MSDTRSKADLDDSPLPPHGHSQTGPTTDTGPVRFEHYLRCLAREYEALHAETDAYRCGKIPPGMTLVPSLVPNLQRMGSLVVTPKIAQMEGLMEPQHSYRNHHAPRFRLERRGSKASNCSTDADRFTAMMSTRAEKASVSSQECSECSSLSRSEPAMLKANSLGSHNEHHELLDSFFTKVQRTTGRKGTITAKKVIELLEASKTSTAAWQTKDVHLLFEELAATQGQNIQQANSSPGTVASPVNYAKKEIPFRLFRNAVLHPNKEWGEGAIVVVDALREVAYSEDALDVIMDAMSVTHWDSLGEKTNPKERALDAVMSFIIVANAVCIGIFAKNTGTEWGVSQTVDSVFTGLFALEIFIKLGLRGWRGYFKGKDWKWNIFDIVIVLLGVTDIGLTLLFSISGEVNTSSFLALRMIRLLRLARLARVYRVSLFRELKLMVNGMLGLLRTLSCTIVVLFLTVYLLGILLVQVLGDVDGDEIVAGQRVLFSTVPRAMYTVFRCLMIGDCVAIDGTPISLHVSESVGWPYTIGYCAASILMNYGLGSLITALVVDSTLNAAKTAEFRKMNREEEKHRIAKKIHTLAEKLQRAQWGRQLTMTDENVGKSTLFITRDLFMEVCRQKDVKAILDEVDVDERDRADLFEAIDADGNGRIELGELVDGIMKMRGTVRKADIVATRLMTGSLLEKVDMLEHTVAEGMIFLESQLMTLTQATPAGPGPVKTGEMGSPSATSPASSPRKSRKSRATSIIQDVDSVQTEPEDIFDC
mmetsp:Transcript_39130/g.92050  ORF Transcript_39130/g.92050 Transcript_39130/m.92050 type:complete len:764 (+) Transcript_39130:129-2420(+)